MKKQYYGLRIKGENKLLQYDHTECNDEFCVGDATYTLTKSGDDDWLVEDIRMVKHVMFNLVPYYNAGYDTPQNPFINQELEIVPVIKTIEYQEPITFKTIRVKLKKCDLNELVYMEGNKYDLFIAIRYATCTAIDLGDTISIVSIDGFDVHYSEEYVFEKKLFEIL